MIRARFMFAWRGRAIWYGKEGVATWAVMGQPPFLSYRKGRVTVKC